jgi:AcrR family transcriptional regulator
VSAPRKASETGTNRARRLGRPPASSSAETRERILRVARERFADLGYESTTNKDIADAASITTGAIYHYFESKRGLYLAVFEEVEQHVFERFREVAAAGDGFLDKLLRVLDESVAIHRNDPSIAAFFVTVPVDSGRSVDLAGLAARQGRDASDFFRALVDEGLARGEIPDDVHPSDLVNMLMAVTSGMARFSSQVGDADVLEAMTRVVERLLRGQLFTALRR